MNIEAQVLQFFRCNHCQEIPNKPVEAQCCAILFCSACARMIMSNNKGCAVCHQKFTYRQSNLSVKFMEKVAFKCEQGCQEVLFLKDVRKHNQVCLKKKVNCNVCKSPMTVNQLFAHFSTEHSKQYDQILINVHNKDQKPKFKIQANKQELGQPIHPQISEGLNQNNKNCWRGMNGKYFCKTKVKLKQGSFECGNTNSCEKCLKLDIKNLKLPKGYLINQKGYVSKYDNKLNACYCGRFLPLSRFSNATAECTGLSPCPDCGMLKMLIKAGMYAQFINRNDKVD